MDRIWKWQSSHINSVFATYEKWVLSLNWPFITHLPYVLLEELCMSISGHYTFETSRHPKNSVHDTKYHKQCTCLTCLFISLALPWYSRTQKISIKAKPIQVLNQNGLYLGI